MLPVESTKVNLSTPAQRDDAFWPAIPLPPSPTVWAPISMPPIAAPMLPVESTKVNLSTPAQRDDAFWPAIPLPPSPTVWAPISMPLADLAKSVQRAALVLGLSDSSSASSIDAFTIDAVAMRPSSIFLHNNSSYLYLAGPSLTDQNCVTRCCSNVKAAAAENSRNSTIARLAPPRASWTKKIRSQIVGQSRGRIEPMRVNTSLFAPMEWHRGHVRAIHLTAFLSRLDKSTMNWTSWRSS